MKYDKMNLVKDIKHKFMEVSNSSEMK